MLEVADADGTVYTFLDTAQTHTGTGGTGSSLPSTIEDRNGNILTFTDQNSGVFHVTDTAGRTLLSSSGFGTTGIQSLSQAWQTRTR